MTTYYIKKGKRYEPIAESEYWSGDAKPLGFHLVTVKPGSTSWKFRIEPDLAGFEAAANIAKEAMIDLLMQTNNASKISIHHYPESMREKALKAHKAWVDIMGDDIPHVFDGVSMNELVEVGMKAIRESYLSEKFNKK